MPKKKSKKVGSIGLDSDLKSMSRDELVAEAIKLRNGIREHRDSNFHELCWHHPQLWMLLPEQSDPLPTVPAWPQFMEGCIQYRTSLDEQLKSAPRTNLPYKVANKSKRSVD